MVHVISEELFLVADKLDVLHWADHLGVALRSNVEIFAISLKILFPTSLKLVYYITSELLKLLTIAVRGTQS